VALAPMDGVDQPPSRPAVPMDVELKPWTTSPTLPRTSVFAPAMLTFAVPPISSITLLPTRVRRVPVTMSD